MSNSALSVFPYRLDAKGQFFPVIFVKLSYGEKAIDAYGLVDSGATVSIFRAEVADALGVNIENGKPIYLGGIGGRIKGYLHKLLVEVAGRRFLCPIVFSCEYLVSFNLLGRQEFFNRFSIVFEEKQNRIKLE